MCTKGFVIVIAAVGIRVFGEEVYSNVGDEVVETVKLEDGGKAVSINMSKM